MLTPNALKAWLFALGLGAVVFGPTAGGCLIYNEDLLEEGDSNSSGNPSAGGTGGAATGGMATGGTGTTMTTGGAPTTTGATMTTGTMTTGSPATGGAGGAPPVLWVNEFHYNNAGGDSMEGVEIAGTAGANLNGYSVVLYNGAVSAAAVTYQTTSLSGSIPNQQNGFGTLWFDITGMQNGDPDGFALVAPGDTVIQFLSYTGTMTAANGPAQGMSSSDVGVSEGDATPLGQSLQLIGTGSSAIQFTWDGPKTGSQGDLNDGQTIQ